MYRLERTGQRGSAAVTALDDNLAFGPAYGVVIAMMKDAKDTVAYFAVRSALLQSDADPKILDRLLRNCRGMLRPEAISRGRVEAARTAFRVFVDNSNPSFLYNPPGEFLSLYGILRGVSNPASIIAQELGLGTDESPSHRRAWLIAFGILAGAVSLWYLLR
jgi:hypothetical protein